MSNGAMPKPEGSDRADAPRHVAIIMDGNGRWAAARGLPRAEGHRRGVEALRKVVRASHELGISYLTIFSFSSENWSRPASEIGDLFGLLRRFIRNDLATLHADGVRVRVIGEREGLESDICSLLMEAEDLTRNNTRLTLVVAFNYGSRQEIANAAQRLARRHRDTQPPRELQTDHRLEQGAPHHRLGLTVRAGPSGLLDPHRPRRSVLAEAEQEHQAARPGEAEDERDHLRAREIGRAHV